MNLIRELEDTILKICVYVIRNGVPDELNTDVLLLNSTERVREVVKGTIRSPGIGMTNFVHNAESEDDVELVAGIKCPGERQISGLVVQMGHLSGKNRQTKTLVSALEDLSSGDPVRERIAQERIAQASMMSGSTPAHELVVLPRDKGTIKESDVNRSNNTVTGTAVDAWTRLGVGELGFILGPPGLGKSHLCMDLGMGYAEHDEGGLVIYFSEEMSHKQLYSRARRRVGMSPKAKDSAFDELESMVVLEDHPTGSSTIPYLSDRVQSICSEVGVEFPSVIIIDYIQIMSLSGLPPFEGLKALCNGARAMGKKFKCPVWSPWQAQRDPTRNMKIPTQLNNQMNGPGELPVLGMADMAECFAAPQIADCVVSLNQSPQEELDNRGRIHLAKLREPTKMTHPKKTLAFTVDKSISRYELEE